MLKWGKVDKLISKIDKKIRESFAQFKAYIKKLLIPLYLFPVKILTYSAYYLVRLILRTIISLIKIIFETIIYPFKGLKNLIKSIFVLALIGYVLASLFVIVDYLTKQYGWWGKFLCSYGTRQQLEKSVVRIVGGYSEGSGFFVGENRVITNFHVIADEPSPKIIFPDGGFVTPVKILANKDADLAVLFTENNYPDFVLPLMTWTAYPGLKPLSKDEPVIASGYPLGTDLSGGVTLVKGNYVDLRQSKSDVVSYMQTNISLVEGMSGGPLTDQCGVVIGVNTLGLAGISFFINGSDVNRLLDGNQFSDTGITKIEVDPSISPAEAVKAFYTYLKARRMQDGFNLLSEEYLKKTNFEEWTNRFTDILDVQVFISEPYENTDDTAFVKFSTKNWNDGEVDYHYYEGTWQTVLENDIYKMLRSNIKEVESPSWDWYYD